MPAKEDKTPAVRPEEHDSDSDEAPEVVTKQSATEKAQTQRQKEKEARTQAKEAAKRKRKSRQESKKQSEVPELPDDVLSAVAARNNEEEEEVDQLEEEEAELRAKKRRAVKDAKMVELMQKKTHTRQFGNIQVQTLDAVESKQTRGLSKSAKEFLALRSAPNKLRMNVLEGHPSLFTKKQKQRGKRA